QALRPALRDVVFVSNDRELVRLHGIVVAANTLEQVPWHVDQMTGRRGQRQQTISRGLSTLRRIARFPQVDPQVQRAGVIRLLLYYLIEGRRDVGGALIR